MGKALAIRRSRFPVTLAVVVALITAPQLEGELGAQNDLPISRLLQPEELGPAIKLDPNVRATYVGTDDDGSCVELNPYVDDEDFEDSAAIGGTNSTPTVWFSYHQMLTRRPSGTSTLPDNWTDLLIACRIDRFERIYSTSNQTASAELIDTTEGPDGVDIFHIRVRYLIGDLPNHVHHSVAVIDRPHWYSVLTLISSPAQFPASVTGTVVDQILEKLA